MRPLDDRMTFMTTLDLATAGEREPLAQELVQVLLDLGVLGRFDGLLDR